MSVPASSVVEKKRSKKKKQSHTLQLEMIGLNG